jgi:hypothetical protein
LGRLRFANGGRDVRLINFQRFSGFERVFNAGCIVGFGIVQRFDRISRRLCNITNRQHGRQYLAVDHRFDPIDRLKHVVQLAR